VGRIGGVAGSLVASQVLVGLTYVVAARGLGPAGLGLIATCFAISTVGATVFDAGLTSYLVREVAAGRVDPGRARSWVRVKRRVVPLLIVPDVVLCLLVAPGIAEGLVLGAGGWVVWEAQTANALLRAHERFSRAASAQLIGRSTGLGVTIVLRAAGEPGLALAVGLITSFLTEALIGRWFLGGAPRLTTRRAEVVAAQRRSLSFGFVSLAAVVQQLDTPLVTLGGGAAAGGVYAGAARLLGPLLFLSSSLALVGGPWLARAQQTRDALRVEERRIQRLAVLLVLGPLTAAAVGPLLIPRILGSDFAESGPTFAVLAIGCALSTVSQGMATVLQNRGAERTVGTAIGVGLCLGLPVTFAFASVAGPVWPATGFLVTQAYIAVHLQVSMRRTAPA